MTNQSIANVSQVYTCSESVSYDTKLVKFDELRQFNGLLKKLIAQLDDSANDDFWMPVIGALKRFYFEANVVPLAQADLEVSVKQLEKSLRGCLASGRDSYPSVMPIVDSLAIHLRQMSESKLDFLFTTLSELVKPIAHTHTALLVKESRLIDKVVSAISSTNTLRGCQVISLADLHQITCYYHLFVFGVPRWYPDYVFASPRAWEVHLVKYSWMRGVWKSMPALAELIKITSHQTRTEMIETVDEVDEIDIEVLFPELNWASIHEKVSKELHGSDTESIEARAYVLEDNWVVFLEAEKDASALVIDFEEGGDEPVRRVDLIEV
jgi:hypothetical protein